MVEPINEKIDLLDTEYAQLLDLGIDSLKYLEDSTVSSSSETALTPSKVKIVVGAFKGRGSTEKAINSHLRTNYQISDLPKRVVNSHSESNRLQCLPPKTSIISRKIISKYKPSP